MDIKPISFQRGHRNVQSPYSELYKAHFNTSYRLGLEIVVFKMVKLIEYFEKVVEGPPLWVCTSHVDLLLFERDFEDYSESVGANAVSNLRLSAHTWPGYYEIKCYLPKSEEQWEILIGVTQDVEIAAQMVVNSLSKHH